MRTLIFVALIALIGCDTTTPMSKTCAEFERKTSPDGVAKYVFHRDTPLAEITKTLPKGSVDYIDFDVVDNPNVLVVVTASAPPRDGLTFKTAFSGNGSVRIEKEWTPSTRKGDDEHVGIFVLPKSINHGKTIRSRKAKSASLQDTEFIFH